MRRSLLVVLAIGIIGFAGACGDPDAADERPGVVVAVYAVYDAGGIFEEPRHAYHAIIAVDQGTRYLDVAARRAPRSGDRAGLWHARIDLTAAQVTELKVAG